MTPLAHPNDSHRNPSLDLILSRTPPTFPEATVTLLEGLRNERLKTGTPNVSDRTGRFLYHLCRDRGHSHILELGTANGYSGIYLLEAISGSKSGHLLTIEIDRDDYLNAKRNLHPYRDHVTLVRSDATEFLRSAGDMRFDLIFIDALKSATLGHFLLARKLLNPGGTIVVDDVVKYSGKMSDFYAYLEANAIPYAIVMTDPDDGVMVLEPR
jgi:predicted O-methyltransferase YrrM